MSHVKASGKVAQHSQRKRKGKRLGLKRAVAKTAISGNIILKQRGMVYGPGKGVGMGKDHTLFAKLTALWPWQTPRQNDRQRSVIFSFSLVFCMHFSEICNTSCMATDTYKLLDITVLQPNPFQPRGKIHEEEVRELLIRSSPTALLEPIVVAHTPAGYQIIAGERRWRISTGRINQYQSLSKKQLPKEC